MIDYKTSGCTKYGAQMGRRSDLRLDTVSKCKLHRVRLDSGGYDQGGAYWGITGGALYYVEATDGEDEGKILYVRGASRDDAKAQFPTARWFRLQADAVDRASGPGRVRLPGAVLAGHHVRL